MTALVTSCFGGDDRAAFAHFDANRDGVIDNDELKALLKDARVGRRLTRWAWAKGAMDEAGTDKSGTISWAEFKTLKSGTE